MSSLVLVLGEKFSLIVCQYHCKAKVDRLYSRICVLCGIRLKYVMAIREADITYTITDFAFWCALEPLLAIISASLPLLAPVFSKLSNNRILSRTQPSMGGKLELKNLGWATSTFRRDQPKPQRFERLQENFDSHYSTEDIKSTFNTTAFSAGNRVQQSDLDQLDRIVVTTDLVVQSSNCIA